MAGRVDLRAQQSFGYVSRPVVQVCLTGDEDQLRKLRLIEMGAQLRNQTGVEVVGLPTHHVGEVKDCPDAFVEDLNPGLGILEGLDLGLGHTSSSRRDDMTGQSRVTFVDDRAPEEDQLLERCGNALLVGPQRCAERLVGVGSPFHLRQGVGQWRSGKLRAALHRASMAGATPGTLIPVGGLVPSTSSINRSRRVTNGDHVPRLEPRWQEQQGANHVAVESPNRCRGEPQSLRLQQNVLRSVAGLAVDK